MRMILGASIRSRHRLSRHARKFTIVSAALHYGAWQRGLKDSTCEFGTARGEDETGGIHELEAVAGEKQAMRIAIDRRFPSVLDKSFGNRPAEIADREPRLVKPVDPEGKIPRVRVVSIRVSAPKNGKPGKQILVDRKREAMLAIIGRMWFLPGHV
jgi:hypothetical protein